MIAGQLSVNVINMRPVNNCGFMVVTEGNGSKTEGLTEGPLSAMLNWPVTFIPLCSQIHVKLARHIDSPMLLNSC